MASKVYFIKADIREGEKVISEKSVKLFKAGDFSRCFKKNDFTAVKVHVGEGTNTTYIKSPCFKGLVEELLELGTKPFLTDTSTLYTGRRHNGIDHSVLASEHGFDINGLGIPFIIPDGIFGTSEVAVEIDGELNKAVSIAYDIERCQSILSLAHFTGHIATGVGATLKTLGMGCSSRKGKMRQHSALKPSVSDKCTLCGECYKHCPADAITLDDVQAHIDEEKCIGCAECVAVCRFGAVQYDWKAQNQELQKNIAEHTAGVLKGKKNRAVFFNFLLSLTKDCDCFNTPDMPLITEDIGIIASTDPVSVDKAGVDLVEEKTGKKLPEILGNERLDPKYQLEHADKIGLGSQKYELLKVD